MSLYNQAYRKNDAQERRVVKSRRRVMIAHDMTSDKEYVICDAAAMVVDPSKIDTISGK